MRIFWPSQCDELLPDTKRHETLHPSSPISVVPSSLVVCCHSQRLSSVSGWVGWIKIEGESTKLFCFPHIAQHTVRSQDKTLQSRQKQQPGGWHRALACLWWTLHQLTWAHSCAQLHRYNSLRDIHIHIYIYSYSISNPLYTHTSTYTSRFSWSSAAGAKGKGQGHRTLAGFALKSWPQCMGLSLLSCKATTLFL